MFKAAESELRCSFITASSSFSTQTWQKKQAKVFRLLHINHLMNSCENDKIFLNLRIVKLRLF